MRREDRFVMSHRPYAIDLGSFHAETSQGWNGEYSHGKVNAAWFRRKFGATTACVGTLSTTQHPPALDVVAFLDGFTDGRYGGDCLARWDGENFWAAGQDPEENARFLARLRPMLERFPNVPDGYDGWWTFQ